MYTQLRDSLQRANAPQRRARGRQLALPCVSSTVLTLGFTSLFTDISSEAVNSVLPLYFLVALRFTPFAFGFIDGLNQGAAALVSLFSGVVTDRGKRYKSVAATGYGISAASRFGLLAAGGAWPALVAVIGFDRIGKGIRTAPRDALIALSSHPEALGVAFGVHRALDTLGALVGPVIAFAILDRTDNSFTAVFVMSACAAIIGLAIILTFLDGRPRSSTSAATGERNRFSLRGAAAMLREPRFGALLVLSTALSLATISDSFLYLVLQRGTNFSIGFFPLLYVGTSLAYFVLAIPVGALADRLGTGRVFVAGYALLLLVYTALLRGSFSTGAVIVYLTLFGAYYAATDGVLRAHASPLLPAALRTTGLGLLTTATSLASLLGSVMFGALWTWRGPHFAVICFFIVLAVAAAFAFVELAILHPSPAYSERQ
jgi:MFS family permease